MGLIPVQLSKRKPIYEEVFIYNSDNIVLKQKYMLFLFHILCLTLDIYI